MRPFENELKSGARNLEWQEMTVLVRKECQKEPEARLSARILTKTVIFMRFCFSTFPKPSLFCISVFNVLEKAHFAKNREAHWIERSAPRMTDVPHALKNSTYLKLFLAFLGTQG